MFAISFMQALGDIGFLRIATVFRVASIAYEIDDIKTYFIQFYIIDEYLTCKYPRKLNSVNF